MPSLVERPSLLSLEAQTVVWTLTMVNPIVRHYISARIAVGRKEGKTRVINVTYQE